MQHGFKYTRFGHHAWLPRGGHAGQPVHHGGAICHAGEKLYIELYDNASLQKGTYRLVFDVAGYFKAKGVKLPEPSFLNQVSLDFGVADVTQHYHVPLLASPWSYSTYRGS